MKRFHEGSFSAQNIQDKWRGLHAGKRTEAMGNMDPFEDVFPIENVDNPLLC